MLTRILQAAAILIAGTATLAAQDYPNRTIKLIVPTGAGGITDILARMVGKSIGEQLGQAVIIDNRTGAGGTIGTRAVAQAEPDGYTLLMAFPSHAANPALYASLPYDSEKDFAPISMVTKVSEILLVPNSSPAKSVARIDRARAHGTAQLCLGRRRKPRTSFNRAFPRHGRRENDLHPLSWRTTGAAGRDDRRSGRILRHAGYRAAAGPGGNGSSTRHQHSQTDRGRAGDPTIAEASVPGYEVIGWNGVLAPANTPRPIIDKLNKAIAGGAEDARNRQVARRAGH